MQKQIAQERTTLVESFLLMGTVVSIRLVGEGSVAHMRDSIDRAIHAMRSTEEACSRFDAASSLRDLCRRPGEWVAVPAALFQALSIAREMAELTGGVFDPTVGRALELQGFNRHYLTGDESDSQVPDAGASWHDIELNPDGMQVRLATPMLLDLGAVAKGLAVDLAAHELGSWPGFSIDAGGDVLVAGSDPEGAMWRVGIEHPLAPDSLLAQLELTNMAICTSGNYKRRSAENEAVHHLWDPSQNHSAEGLKSCTVVAPQAVLADVVSTAAFVLGPKRALSFIEEMDLAGVVVHEDMTVQMTKSMGGYIRE